MLRNFIITSLRILWRNKLVSAINILSLSIGITAFLLILLYVHHETSYDKFNENYDRIYRLEGDENARLPLAIGDHLRDKIPEIEHITQLHVAEVANYNFFYIQENDPTSSTAIQTTMIRADSTIFNVFTLPFIKGNPDYALNKPYTAVLTESTAKRLFGNANPIGKTIRTYNLYQPDNQYKVTGVMRDVKKSHVKIDALLSINNDDWQRNGLRYGIYALLTPHANPDVVAEKINSVLADFEHRKNAGPRITVYKEFYLRPLKDLYLNDSATKELYGEHGNGKLLRSFLAIALFVFLLAIINYINLTTARSILRSKEVILKKVMGSGKGLLRLQFIIESILITIISFLIALTTIQLLIPKFNQLAMAQINISEYNIPIYWILMIGAILLTGIVTGIYPAFMLTSFRSVANIQGQSMSGKGGIVFRRLLLTFQSSISIILIIGILTNFRQLQFVKNADPGFNKEQVLLFKVPGRFEQEYLLKETVRDRLLRHPGIEKVSFTSGTHLGEQSSIVLEIEGADRYFTFKLIDPDYIDLMGIELVEGRNFSWDRESDKFWTDYRKWSDKYGILINETAAREYWSESPVGKIYRFPGQQSDVQIEIIGIVKDVHYQSMHHKVEPMIYYWRGYGPGRMSVKISPVDMQSTIKTIEDEWKQVYGAEPFFYSFLDEEFGKQYAKDERATTIIGYFTIIAIVIACMGLFALSSFMAVRRTKEIGIRKALGASSKTIFVMLSREYIKWILLSALIATPIAWYAMNKWLETFAYRIELGPGVFIIAAIIALGISLITVGWQALKSAVANPVEALRYE